MNYPSGLNNSKNVNNQGVAPYVPIIQARVVRDVAVPVFTNWASSIRRPPSCGRFELKQNIVQILHSNEQFTGLHHEDPQSESHRTM